MSSIFDSLNSNVISPLLGLFGYNNQDPYSVKPYDTSEYMPKYVGSTKYMSSTYDPLAAATRDSFSTTATDRLNLGQDKYLGKTITGDNVKTNSNNSNNNNNGLLGSLQGLVNMGSLILGGINSLRALENEEEKMEFNEGVINKNIANQATLLNARRQANGNTIMAMAGATPNSAKGKEIQAQVNKGLVDGSPVTVS